MHDVAPAIPPVIKTLDLGTSAEKAFDHFVDHIGSWWPSDTHSINPGKVADIVIERVVGGLVYELTVDGEKCRWGEVLEFEAGRKIRFSWVLNGPESDATEVAISFDPLGDKNCRMTLVHSGWDSRSDGDTWRDQYNNGWNGVLAGYVGTLPVTGTQ